MSERCPVHHVSFSQPDVQSDIGPFAKRLLEERVYIDPITNLAVVSHYEDIAYVSAHPELFSNRMSTRPSAKSKEGAAQELKLVQRYAERGFLPFDTLVTNDPPSHTSYRKIVDKIFTPATVQKFEAEIRTIVDELIDEIGPKGSADMMADFSIKVPLFFIMSHLGVDRSNWRRVKTWADTAIESINPTIDPDRELEIADIQIEMQQFINASATTFEANPAPTILSLLQHAEVDGERLDRAALVNIASQIFVAGHETTGGLIGNGLYMLLNDPALMQRLKAEPDKVSAFVEEVLRVNPPIPHRIRLVAQDTELHGVKLKAGSMLLMSLISGNLDPDKFTDPDEVSLDRRNGRQHLTFGQGIHYCIGNIVARAEARIAFQQVLARLPNIKLDETAPPPKWALSFQAHTLANLSVTF